VRERRPEGSAPGLPLSPNYDTRPAPVDTLILHYTGMQSAQAAIDRLCDPAARVSSHYVVDEDGSVFALVPEHLRAWHAGISYWRGRETLNDVSIGIEIVNPGHQCGYRPFPAVQIDAVTILCREILSRHAIPGCKVVGHSDVAPDRKQDPGELFPWRNLASCGIGLWPDVPGVDTGASDWPLYRIRDGLATIGYRAADASEAALATIVTAFQRHWRPETINGVPDAGTTARLEGLLRL
jgi:N-acetylmuramoyl-L-alanine amidase